MGPKGWGRTYDKSEEMALVGFEGTYLPFIVFYTYSVDFEQNGYRYDRWRY